MMRNLLLTYIRVIFSYDLIYINSLLDYLISNKGLPQFLRLGSNQSGLLYFGRLSNYLEFYGYISRIEIMDEVITKYECQSMPSLDYVINLIYKIYFPDWIRENLGPGKSIATSSCKISDLYNKGKYILLFEEYIIIRYKDKYRGEILDDLIN